MREYRLRTLEKRRAYFQEYYRQHKSYATEACPDCGQPKWIKAKRCRPCAYKVGWNQATKKIRAQKLPPDCLYCTTQMRRLDWHERHFWRCPGCGLETTDAEVKRFTYEERWAA